MKTKVSAPAKINLTLDITGKREDGYHYVDMIMQSVSLYDEVTVELTDGGGEISLSCNKPDIPCNSKNTAYKAAELFLNELKASYNVKIDICKCIPSQAGLAGGSTDGAAVLFALNYLLGSPLEQSKLLTLCSQIGADVPFCLLGGTALATGIGTDLKKTEDMPQCFIVIVKPPVNVSTKLAYERSDARGYSGKIHSTDVLTHIRSNSISGVALGLYNEFENVLELNEIECIKEKMCKNGALGASMSGSGSAVFGIYDSEQAALGCADILKKEYNEVFVANPVKHGCKIINE